MLSPPWGHPVSALSPLQRRSRPRGLGRGAVLPSPWHHLSPVVLRRGLPTDRHMWSDATGLQECTKASTKPPSLQWTWVSSGLGRGGGCSGGCPPALTHSSPRFLTGSWISASLGARTRRGGSTPATSLREHVFLCVGRGPQGAGTLSVRPGQPGRVPAPCPAVQALHGTHFTSRGRMEPGETEPGPEPGF